MIRKEINNFFVENKQTIFLNGDALKILKELPDESVDVIITSPPYYNQREYDGGGIGRERTYEDYIDIMLKVTAELYRVLKKSGSFWLNIGDTYKDKKLLGVPWRLAIKMEDQQGWIMRNEIIWNKMKGGMDSSKDKLGNVHEKVFHFVKEKKGYFYDVDKIRKPPKETKIIRGNKVSATGVSGVKYRKQIESSVILTNEQKKNALDALENVLDEINLGKLADFRMIINGSQRTTHSNSRAVSGRAKELSENGFYILKYNSKGAKPTDIWDVLPESTHRRKLHYAPFPEELLEIPLLATLPDNGIVLDPFSGTGTTAVATTRFGGRSINIELSSDYIELAKKRIKDVKK